MAHHNRRTIIGIYMLAFVALADQVTKGLVLESVHDVNHILPLTSFLNLVLVRNEGITFGILSHIGHSYMPFILVGIAAVIMGMLGRWLWRTHETGVALALGAIMGGAIGNVIDRLHYGAVVDFIDFYYDKYHWPAFNFADSAIVVGVALLLIDGMLHAR